MAGTALNPPAARDLSAHVRRSRPSLFDRLRVEPDTGAPSPQARREAWRALVLRDLQVLLNTVNHESLLDPLRHAAIRASCWNFGLEATAGDFPGPAAWVRIEAGIRAAIERFEPRILARSLQVLPLHGTCSQPRHNVLHFEIRGCIHDPPQDQGFAVHSRLDLETRQLWMAASKPSGHVSGHVSGRADSTWESR